MNFILMSLFIVSQLCLVNVAGAETQAERRANINRAKEKRANEINKAETIDFIKQTLRIEKDTARFENLIKWYSLEKEVRKSVVRPADCAIGLGGTCNSVPSRNRSKMSIVSRTYLVWGDGFDCEVKGVWQDGTVVGWSAFCVEE